MPENRVYAAESRADLERLRALLAGQGDAALGSLERHLARPRYRSALTRMIERAGELAGAALIAHTRLRLGAVTIETGHVELLHTTPAARATGALEILLGDCLRTLAEEGWPLVTIDGPSDMYGQFGFAPFRLSTSIEAPTTAANPPAASLRAAGESDLEDLAALYAASYDAIPLVEARTSPDWIARLAATTHHVLEDGRGRVLAYAVTSPGLPQSGVLVSEAAAADSGAARALLHGLAALAPHAAPGRVCLHLPLAHRVAQAALHLGGEGHIVAPHSGRDEAALAGVVDLPGMLATLTPELDRRLARSRYAGWSGNLRVEVETERVTLAIDRGRTAVIDGSRPADLRLRRVQLPALAQLCLGYRAVSDLRATGGLDCDDTALGLLDALFPVT